MFILVDMYSALVQCLQLWIQLHLWITIVICLVVTYILSNCIRIKIVISIWHNDMTDCLAQERVDNGDDAKRYR